MSFNSLTFLFVLLPLTIILYFFTGWIFAKKEYCIKIQNIVLVLSSLVFFGWSNTSHIKVLLFLILLNYAIGIIQKKNKKIAILGIVFNLMILIYFKYISLVLDSLQRVLKNEINSFEVIAPLGISFIVFHCISYMMDLYNDNAEPCYSLVDFSLYITFFPKLVQGPIVKYKDMVGEIKYRKYSLNNVTYGIERFILGMAKKLLIADALSVSVADIYGLLPNGMDVLTAWLGTIFFTLQIYFDFSGYSDMAIGLSKIFGFNFKENFDFPYHSKSITEFWRRWHISLGAWFREYLYFPLGGNRKGNVYINLFIVFMATGIWHGGAWIYLLWGAAHGLCVVAERYLKGKKVYQNIPNALKWFFTIFIVNIGWICFKVPSVTQFFQYLKYMIGIGVNTQELTFTYQYFLTQENILIVLCSCVGMLVLGSKKIKAWYVNWQNKSVIFNGVKYIVLCVIMYICYTAIVSGTYSPFLYFQY